MSRYLTLVFVVAACGGDDSASHPPDAPHVDTVACDTAPPAATCSRLGPQFSSSGMNPAGEWSYGYSTTLGGAFQIFTVFLPGNNVSLEGLDMWGDPALVDGSGAHLPTVGINAGATTSNPIGTYTVDPGQILAHPGMSGQVAIARWTAPAAGMYRVQATFTGLSGFNGAPHTTTDVHVQRAGVDVLANTIDAYGAAAATCDAAVMQVGAGETLDFAVGYGNGSYLYDATGIDAIICPAP